jgi:hypothetical protein
MMSLTNNNYVSLLPGSILSGVSVYIVLSYLFVPIGITGASAIIMSVLVFGLSRFFTLDNRANDKPQNRVNNEIHEKVHVSISNKEEIRFHNMGLQDSSADHQTIIMKRPEINASGNITVNNLYVPA